MTGFRSSPALACAFLLMLPLGACVGANPSAQRATELASLVSRSIACKAGAPRRDTLTLFLKAEEERGATAEQIAGARSTYVTVSEAQTINQGIRPERCSPEERSAVGEKMSAVRAGRFDAF
jgi:hypothetical protein